MEQLEPGLQRLDQPYPPASMARTRGDGALKSMMGPIERIALLFGWAACEWADEYDRRAFGSA
jgi:hypothetical protein